MPDLCHRGKPHLWSEEEGGRVVHEDRNVIVRECARCQGHRWFRRTGEGQQDVEADIEELLGDLI